MFSSEITIDVSTINYLRIYTTFVFSTYTRGYIYVSVNSSSTSLASDDSGCANNYYNLSSSSSATVNLLINLKSCTRTGHIKVLLTPNTTAIGSSDYFRISNPTVYYYSSDPGGYTTISVT